MEDLKDLLNSLNLEKEELLPKVTNVKIGLIWDMITVDRENKKFEKILKEEKEKYNLGTSYYENSNYKNADVNLSFFAFRNGIPKNVEDLIFYGSKNPKAIRGLIPNEDNRYGNYLGAGEDSEVAYIDFEKLDCDIDRIAVMVSIYMDKKEIEKENYITFGAIKNVYVNIVENWDLKEKQQIYKASLTENNALSVVVLVGEFLKKKNDVWVFKEMNKGYITEEKEIIDKETGEMKKVDEIATILTVINEYIKESKNNIKE